METKRELFYIRSAKGRGDEAIKMLEDKGGVVNNLHLKRGIEDEDIVHFIGEDNLICTICDKNPWFDFIKWFGTELHLPKKPKELRWEEIENVSGYELLGIGINNVRNMPTIERNGITHINKHVFATEQQAKSAQAAAMISQIRAQGEEEYGYIVERGKRAAIIHKDYKGHIYAVAENYTHGGLLRFNTIAQAQIFLDNNRDTVEQYLMTF